MKKQFLFLTTVLVYTFSIISCKKSSPVPPPTADFSYSANNLAVPAKVTFTNLSSSYYAQSWDFGDGQVSSAINPTNTYMSSGTKTIRLTVTGQGGTNTITKTVTILPAYTKTRIDKIFIASLQSMPSGNFSAYIKITNNASTVWQSETFINLNSSTFPINFVFGTPYTITNLNATYLIEVWKYNSIGSDTKLGYIGFSPFIWVTPDIGYPASITMPASVSGSGAILYLTWQ